MPAAETDTRPGAPKLVAPLWHTALLVAVFLAFTVAGVFFQKAALAEPSAVRPPTLVPLYLSMLALEWGLLYFVWKGGLRRSGTTLRELIGGRWTGIKDPLLDVALAGGLWALWKAAETGADRLLGEGHAASIEPLLPRRPVEIALWVLLSLSAGICEEVVFRGYFQRQFEVLARHRWAGLVLQALLFGVAHGYQGVLACSKIAVLGAAYGGLAIWRRSLRPGMIAHAGTDVLGGIFGI
jgi:hypothetical protein